MSQVNFLQSLGWSLISSLWQMALLWIVYQFITVFFHYIRPRHKTSLATAFTLAGFVWFIYTFFTSLFTESTSISGFYYSGIISKTSWNYFAGKILPYVSVVYLLILLASVWQFIRNYRFVQMIRNNGIKKMDVAWRLYMKNTAAAMGITREVKIWLSDWVASPVTIGYLKPIVLVPVAAINNLTPHQLEAIILHELSHIYRYDYFFNLIISFIKTVLYFNPFVKLLARSIEREREYSCDEMVLQFQYKPGEYASALLRLEQNKHRRQMMMAAAGKNHDLLHRIESILGMRNKGWQPLRQISISLVTMLGIILLHFFVAVNKDNNKQAYFALANETSPYYFLNGKTAAPDNFDATKFAAKNAKKKKLSLNSLEEILSHDISTTDAADAPGFINVGYAAPVIPELAHDEETKVKEAVNATKRILQEDQWKALEKTYAEVFTSSEKTKLKSEYINEVNKAVNWDKIEDQLRLSYEQINWDKLNDQIRNSLCQIKLDSIRHQLNLKIKSLIYLEKALKENKITAVPDTEISLRAVIENQQKAKAQLANLNALRGKKIIRL